MRSTSAFDALIFVNLESEIRDVPPTPSKVRLATGINAVTNVGCVINDYDA